MLNLRAMTMNYEKLHIWPRSDKTCAMSCYLHHLCIPYFNTFTNWWLEFLWIPNKPYKKLSFECTKLNISSFQRWTSLTPMVYKTCINSQYVRFFLWRGWKCCSNKAWCRHTWCRISSSGLMYISSPLFCNSPFCFYNNKENSKLYSKTQYW